MEQSAPETSSTSPFRHVLNWLPGLAVLRSYQRSWLRYDLIAGIVLTAILVPVGMAYAEASGLPPITGLYATIVPLVVYALFGPSRILVLGPDSSLAGIIAAVILPLAAGDQARAVALAGALSIFAGLICVAAGICRLGFITDLISRPVRIGYIHGIALTVIVSQLPKMFGFSISADGLIDQARAFANGVRDGETNGTALLIGLGCLLVIFACKVWLPKVPGVLLAVVGSSIVVAIFGLAESAGLTVVGVLPKGLPPFEIPTVSRSDIRPLLAGAVGIAIVSFADTSVLSRTFAIRGGYRVNPNQELIALGAANISSGMFNGFAVSSSSSRTPVAEAAGSKTQLTGLVGAAAIVILLIAAPGLLKDLPSTALAAVVISAAIGLIDLGALRKLYQLRKSEFALSIVCFLGVAVVGVLPGIFIAIGLSLLAFIERAWRPYDAVLGRVDGLSGYHDMTRYPDARRIPGLVLFRWDAPLFFANAELFQERVIDAIEDSPSPAKWVVVAAEPITDVDTTAADWLIELINQLRSQEIVLCFAEMKDPVKDQLKQYGLYEEIGDEHFFPTMGRSVRAYVESNDVDWVDWEDALEAAEQSGEIPTSAKPS